MAITAKIDLKDQDLLKAIQGFLKGLLSQNEIGALLVPWKLPMKNMVMPTLITDPERLDQADPLSPAFPMNSAKIVSRLTRKPSGVKVAAVMRPCEIRAFVELVKLKQGRTEDLILIGVDCLGAYQNREFSKLQAKDSITRDFYQKALAGDGTGGGGTLAPACQICEMPVPDGADLSLGLFGVDTNHQVLVQSRTPAGDALLKKMGLPETEEPSARKKAVDKLVEDRTSERDKVFGQTREATANLEKLGAYLANCVNCYNCRVACPVCYCRECVFVTDVFDHDPAQYLRWADKKGVVKMPTDTIFYHLTRMVHMSTACVGCGQCSNACPNDISVMELIRTTAHKTQAAFEYLAGRNLNEAPPMSIFREDEFPEVTTQLK